MLTILIEMGSHITPTKRKQDRWCISPEEFVLLRYIPNDLFNGFYMSDTESEEDPEDWDFGENEENQEIFGFIPVPFPDIETVSVTDDYVLIDLSQDEDVTGESNLKKVMELQDDGSWLEIWDL